MEYRPLKTRQGKWIKQGNEDDAKKLIGRLAVIEYQDGEYRTVQVTTVTIYGGLLVPFVKTVHKTAGLKHINFPKEPEAIHYGRLELLATAQDKKG